MYFLGLSALDHDTAAALLGDHGFVAAIEESKLTRSRKTAGIPREAARFCLQRAAIAWRELSAIAVASRPWRLWARRAAFRARFLLTAPVPSSYYEGKAAGELAAELNNQRILGLLSGDARVRVLSFDHHLCHAASAFYASDFDRAVVLSLDQQGGGQSGIVALGESGKLRVLRRMAFPHSLGWVYSQVTELVGYRPGEQEHKTQWLSLTATPKYVQIFLDMMRRPGSLYPKLHGAYFTRGFSGRLAFSPAFYGRLGISPPLAEPLREDLRAALASSLQKACEIVVTELAQSLSRDHPGGNLCLAGGLFLNPLLVAELEKNSGFARVFVQSAAGNEGTALGAAWLAQRKLDPGARTEPFQNICLGPSYRNEEIKQVLDNCKATYRWLESEEQGIHQTVRLLAAGKIVAWFQQAAEFGPRALGNRSLLASPWAPYVKENLNDYVKHREPFRPFALSVPEEEAPKYFEAPTPAARWVATMGKLRPEHAEWLSAHALPERRVRLHVVAREASPRYWSLLQAFGAHARAPILLNASFNLFGEPLVVSPRDAVRSYFCSGVDALVIGNFLLEKS